ncbi:hypothetical protein CFK37_08665 [Virgibacillus phasianinus]|uniref:alpha-L-fucosidase n=1 Tax=Virgibacillus phasianinus TaxID=2017483 RepID=A0A220U256_9BACI|nr:alpha-L-fucosidase [Virgibacillus phasianinus]ASK62228.1 hypothetical protein CFK37_08665 [Virgibacillus phasianinus]
MSTGEIKPTAKQLEYQAWEFGLFIHFGLRTFYEGYVDFDKRPMYPARFNPSALDCEQWILTAKAAGMKYAVLTAKHHDGFSNWPSRFTDFSVANSAWKDGKGDVVQEFTAACHKHGIKPGLYYSPYDGSADFYHDKDGKAYDDYFINQITELLTNYGDVDILWFDGAGSENHEYDWQRIVDTVRSLQPNILLFNMADPDFRWIGNEDGIAPTPCWNEVDTDDLSDYHGNKGRLWLPAECDVQMRDNWFYSENDEHTVKSLEQLMGIYYYSIGHGANLLLNIGPNRQGLLPEKDRRRLVEFGDKVRERFASKVATIDQFEQRERTWMYQAKEPHMLNHVVIQEDLRNGENVESFKVAIISEKSRQKVTIYEGRSIGNKAIIQVPAIKVRGVEVEVTKSTREPRLKGISVY